MNDELEISDRDLIEVPSLHFPDGLQKTKQNPCQGGVLSQIRTDNPPEYRSRA
jgi:hypothetical protein